MKSIAALYSQVLGQPLLLLRFGGFVLLVLVTYHLLFQGLVSWLVPFQHVGAWQITSRTSQAIFFAALLAHLMLFIWMGIIFSVRWHQYVLLGLKDTRFFRISLKTRERLFTVKSLLIILSIFVGGVIFAFVAFFLSVFVDGLVFGNVTDAAQSRFDFRLLFRTSGLASPFNAVRIEGVALLTRFPAVEFGLNVVFILAAIYVVGRWSLVFPATALGFAMRIRDSWRETRGNGLRILTLMVAVSLPALVASEISVQIQPFAGLPPFLYLATTAVTQSLFFLMTVALWSSAFAHIYKALGLPLHPPQPHMPGNA